MSTPHPLDSFNLEDLINEVKRRNAGDNSSSPGNISLRRELESFDTPSIIEAVIREQRSIYGEDNRQDLFEVTDSAILNNADSVVSFWATSWITDNGDGTSSLRLEVYRERDNLCAGVRFSDQYVGRVATGFLVASNIIATAGHVIEDRDLDDLRVVFGFSMLNPDANQVRSVINNNEIYRLLSIVDSRMVHDDYHWIDWALVRLDRPVYNHGIVSMRRSGEVSENQPLYSIGHSNSLPIKYSSNANVRDNGFDHLFIANLDSSHGASGSPVFNATTHQVEGVLVGSFDHEGDDYISDGDCNRPLICPEGSECIGINCNRVTEFSHLIPPVIPLPHILPNPGMYTIQQKSTNRFLDAYISSNNHNVVTRPAQNNDTQRWILTPIEGTYTIQQKSTGRFLDAYTSSGNNFSVVTRSAQNNDTQLWIIKSVGNGIYTIRQKRNNRFLDAYTSSNNHTAVTRPAQNNDTQEWVLTLQDDSTYTIQHSNNNRYLDAYESSNNFDVVTRTAQNNDTQRWILNLVEQTYSIQQRRNFRFLDAYTSGGNDYSAVTRPAQNNNTQRWIIKPERNQENTNEYTIRQKSNGRYLDAHTSSGNNYSAVTRSAQNNDTQRWILNPVSILPPPPTIQSGTYRIQQVSNNRYLDAYEHSSNHRIITRRFQNNETQEWIFSLIGGIYEIQQSSNGRYLDAYTSSNDHYVVTRPAQNNDTQRWILLPLGYNTYTVQQLNNFRYLDAYELPGSDHNSMTRIAQNNDTQRWILTALGSDTFTIQQKSSGRFLDAFINPGDNYLAMTRPFQNNDTQRWVFYPVGGVYTIQQRSTNRFFDANPSGGDYAAFTRPVQNNESQMWIVMNSGPDIFTIQHFINGRFLDAYEWDGTSGADYRAMTRPPQNNDSQRWRVVPI